jgi:serine/threonine protein kinase
MTYLARDCDRPDQPLCVIKRLLPARQDQTFLQIARRLLKAEAEILNILGNHDYMPKLIDSFEENQEFYLVEDFVEGQTLSQELKQRRFQEAEVVALLQELLTILAFIHDHHVIHRDLKPSNISRRVDGRLVLIDFGAVKYVQPRPPEATELLTIAIGTEGYAAPEQIMGRPQFSSDIYALGMIAIQALTGIAPHNFVLDTQTLTLNWQSYAQASPPLAQILAKMTCYHSSDRYRSARTI